jgi:hypothetical protein
MEPRVERVAVNFDGPGAGRGELSWGQRDIWHAITRYREAMPIGGVKPLPAGTTVADIADELRYLMTNFPTMRTRIAPGPVQHVAGTGTIFLEVVDGGDDPDAVAATVERRFRATPFDYAVDWPVRMAMVRRGDTVTHMVVIMCHVALDGAGGLVMQDEVARRAADPDAVMQPLEQAAWQASPAGRRQTDSAVRYATGILRSVPAVWDGESTDRRSPRHWEGEFTSPAMAAALAAVEADGAGDGAAALLAAYAVAFGRLAGVNPVVLRPMVSNRFRPRLGNVVSPLAQAGLCQLDVADVPFAEATERARRAAMLAYKHGYFDSAAMTAAVAAVVAERGPAFEVDCFFNDRRTASRLGPAGDPGASEFRWTGMKDTPSARLFVQVDEAPGALRVNVFADTWHLSPADAEALLRSTEAILVAGVADPTRLPPHTVAA